MKQNKGSRNRFTFIQSLDFDKRGKAIQWEKESLFKRMVLAQLENHTRKKKVKLNRNLTLYIFKNWIWTDLNKKANYYKTSERKQNIFMPQKVVTIKENKKYRIDLYEFKTLAL